jgi:ABC-type dipeptide/oligopeptide/nickel transport system ATPase component
LHPYTKDLLSAIPLAGELGIEKVTLKGEIGDPTNPQRVADYTQDAHIHQSCVKVKSHQ